MMSSKSMFISCIIAILISSCQPSPAIESSPTEKATSTMLPMATGFPTIMVTETAIETVTPIPATVHFIVSPKSCASSNGQLPVLSNMEIPFNLGPKSDTLGGGIVQSNEFSIELYLFCDSNFQTDAMEQYHTSDIDGLAIYYNWRYDGPNIDAGVTGARTFTFFGIDPDIQLRSVEGGGGQRQGHVSQGNSTGIVLPIDLITDFSEKKTMDFVYIMESPSGNLSGARLSFDLQQISDGLQPDNVVVIPLSDVELASFEYVKDMVE